VLCLRKQRLRLHSKALAGCQVKPALMSENTLYLPAILEWSPSSVERIQAVSALLTFHFYFLFFFVFHGKYLIWFPPFSIAFFCLLIKVLVCLIVSVYLWDRHGERNMIYFSPATQRRIGFKTMVWEICSVWNEINH
jgi:hypothetical protein